MNYQPTNGHTDTLVEPNSTTGVVYPATKKSKKGQPDKDENVTTGDENFLSNLDR